MNVDKKLLDGLISKLVSKELLEEAEMAAKLRKTSCLTDDEVLSLNVIYLENVNTKNSVKLIEKYFSRKLNKDEVDLLLRSLLKSIDETVRRNRRCTVFRDKLYVLIELEREGLSCSSEMADEVIKVLTSTQHQIHGSGLSSGAYWSQFRKKPGLTQTEAFFIANWDLSLNSSSNDEAVFCIAESVLDFDNLKKLITERWMYLEFIINDEHGMSCINCLISMSKKLYLPRIEEIARTLLSEFVEV